VKRSDVEFHPAARLEVERTHAWYRVASDAAADGFLLEIELALDEIAEAPNLCRNICMGRDGSCFGDSRSASCTWLRAHPSASSPWRTPRGARDTGAPVAGEPRRTSVREGISLAPGADTEERPPTTRESEGSATIIDRGSADDGDAGSATALRRRER
jgi:hypothetical protein